MLPYASLNEERDQWRADFYKRFAPYVENCKTLEEAIKAVNKNIRDEVKVDYNTARETGPEPVGVYSSGNGFL